MKRAWSAGVLLALTACLSRPMVRPPGDPEVGVNVRGWGHSCFSLRDSADRVILVDPFDDTVGYPPPKVKPDAVIVTHEHFDHDALPKIPTPPPAREGSAPASGQENPRRERERHGPDRTSAAPFSVVRSTGTQTAAGIEFTGVLGEHDDEGGRRNGTTRMFVWEMGGLRWAHLGDIGQRSLRPDQRAALAGVDVLFIPVGGRTTVDAAGAAGLIEELHPRVVIPMHYGTPRTRFFEFDPLGPFLALFKRVTLLPQGGFQLRRADLPADTTVYVPAPPGDAETP